MDNQTQPLPSQFFSAESAYLLDVSAQTQAKYIEAMRERARQQSEADAAGNAAVALIESELRAAEQRTDAELRDMLQQTIDNYDSALNQVGIAQANVDRAKHRMDTADAELADYHDLDDRITAHHVAQIKAGTDHPLPAALQAAESQRGQLVDRIAANHRVHATLVSELEHAQRHLANCAASRSRAASHVIAKQFDQVATELNTAMDAVIALRRKIVSAGSTWVSTTDGTNPLGLSAAARSAVFRQIEDVQPDSALIEQIRDWHSRLLNDAGASEFDALDA